MQISMTTRHGDTTPAIEEYVHKKAERFSRYFDRISAIEVIVDHQKAEHLIECIVSIEHGDAVVSHASSDDLYAAIDQCTDRAVRQLSDLKSKLRDDKHHTPTSGAEE
ncbi:MAG: ribosome-associated translation inhibitor RaiA [Phycisphaerales bacterium]|jgi:putative sigma-54 modulation protein|nr:ribosome-associated translation inhibitor RaiA [Phycisphaerales bacterium]